MPPTKKADATKDSDTIQLRQYSPTSVKRKHGSSYTLDPQDEFKDEFDAATKEAIKKQDRLDETFEPEDDGKPAAKKPKTSRKQENQSNLYCLGIYSPPEKPESQSLKNWAVVHYRKTTKQFPDSQKVSLTGLRAAYEGSKALNIFLWGEFEYQSDVASELRKKGTKDWQKAQLKIDELEVAVGNLQSVRSPSKKQTNEAQKPSPPKVAQTDNALKSRFESISTNLANEVGSLKMQLELEKHDKGAAEQAKQNAQREPDDVKAQIMLLQETVEQPSAALRTELAEHKEKREQAEKQLKEALSDRSKAESEILRLKEVMEDGIKRWEAYDIEKHQIFETAKQELEKKLGKQGDDLRLMEKRVKEQQAAFTTAKACLKDL